MTKKILMLGTTFKEIPINPPCECGAIKPIWRGDKHGLRVYLCDTCLRERADELALDAAAEETTITADTTCNQTNKETTR